MLSKIFPVMGCFDVRQAKGNALRFQKMTDIYNILAIALVIFIGEIIGVIFYHIKCF